MSADAATADFFPARTGPIVDLRQPLVVLASRMPWQQIEASLAHLFSRKAHWSGHARSGLVWRGSFACCSPVNARRPRIPPHHDRCSTSSTPLT
ncbi:MAG: hypothetical protein IPJ36_17225 [Simplicispira sp.]|nr:hypothetical protein [Simplicispira sp.]